jgi:hypothetical protein
MSSEVVAIEIVRTLVGSIGLMASVPLTTILAAWLARPLESEIVARPDPMADDRPPPQVPDDDPFAEARPFSADDEAETEWERRLRDSYGLDRLHAARWRERD